MRGWLLSPLWPRLTLVARTLDDPGPPLGPGPLTRTRPPLHPLHGCLETRIKYRPSLSKTFQPLHRKPPLLFSSFSSSSSLNVLLPLRRCPPFFTPFCRDSWGFCMKKWKTFLERAAVVEKAAFHNDSLDEASSSAGIPAVCACVCVFHPGCQKCPLFIHSFIELQKGGTPPRSRPLLPWLIVLRRRWAEPRSSSAASISWLKASYRRWPKSA